MWKYLLNKVFKAREKLALDLGEEDVEKPFLEHLEDLRDMIVRMAITLVVVTLFTFVYCKELLTLIQTPVAIAGLTSKIMFINMQVTGGFMTAMNISLVAGIVLSFPILLYFFLLFVLPGLRKNEKQVLWPALAIGAGLFITGMVFAFYVVAPRALTFFYEFAVDFLNNFPVTGTQAAATVVDANAPPCPHCTALRHDLEGLGLLGKTGAGAFVPGSVYPWDITNYVKFISQFVLIFGACFELPVVVMALVKLDVLNYGMMKGTRAWAFLIIAIVAALITPTQDILTLSLLAVPMYILYEICIWLSYFMEKKDRQAYPEYYQQLDEDAKRAETEPVTDDWDNEEYNPWATDDEDKEEEDRPVASKPKPDTEKSLEDFAREDENRSNTD